MGNIVFSNNASSTLAAGIADTDVSLTVEGGQGALFPNVSAPTFAKLTIEDVSGNIEIVHLTAKAGDVFTIVRAQEGTIALNFASGSRVENRVTAAALNEYLQKSGDAITGTIEMTGSGRVEGGHIRNSPLRGADGGTANQLVVPTAAGAPTIGGSVILTEANFGEDEISDILFPVGTVLMFFGDIGDIPDGFQACDGTNGTPDMRNRFVVGAGDTYTVGQAGASITKTTAAGGAHTPVIQNTSLTIAQVPAHSHRLYVYQTGDNADARAFGSADVNGVGGVRLGGGALTFGYREATLQGNDLIEETGGSGGSLAHGHTATAVPDHTHTVDVRPPFRALFFIMKV